MVRARQEAAAITPPDEIWEIHYRREDPGDTTNGFVEFLSANKEMVDGFFEAGESLDGFERQWMHSPLVHHVANQYADILYDAYGPNSHFPPIENLRAAVHNDLILGTLVENLRDLRIARVSMARYSRKVAHLVSDIEPAVEIFDKERKALVDIVKSSRGALFAGFGVFLKADVKNLFDFERFLADEKYTDLRGEEEIESFLKALAEQEAQSRKRQQPGMFDQAANEWKEQLQRNPEGYMLKIFFEQDKLTRSEEVNGQRETTILASDSELYQTWEFALMMMRKVFPQHARKIEQLSGASREEVLGYLPPYEFWPTSVKQAYQRHLNNEFNALVPNIRRALAKLLAPTSATAKPDVIVFGDEGAAKKEKTRGVPVQVDEFGATPGAVLEDIQREKTGEELFPKRKVAFLSGQVASDGQGQRAIVASEEEIQEEIDKQARKITKDTRMRDDIRAMFESLREYPFGKGVERLVSRTISIGGKVHKLYRLDPRDRRELRRLHENSRRVRIIFAVLDNSDSPTGEQLIVLDGIYGDHDSAYLDRIRRNRR